MKKVFSICLLLLGCATVDRTAAPKKFVVEKMWVRDTAQADNLGYRRMHRMTPVVTDQFIYQGNSFDGLVVYNRETARVEWRMYIKDGVEAGAALVGGVLYFGANNGYFYAVDAVNGQVRWSVPIRSEGLGEPVVKDNVVYFMSGANVAYALETQTGKQLWLYNRRDPSSLSIRGNSKPSILGNSIYFGFSDGYVVSLNRQSGAMEWEQNINQNKRFRDVDSTPIIDQDRLFVTSFDGGLYCLNRLDGKIVWSVDEGGDSSPVVTAEKVFYSTSTGEVRAIEKSTGKTLWKKDLNSRTATRPVLHRGLLVFGEYEGKLKFVDAQNGEDVGFFEPGRGVSSAPYIDTQKNEVFFISADANLFAVKMAWKSPVAEWPWEKQP